MLHVGPEMFGFTRQMGGQALLLLRKPRFVLIEWCAMGLREEVGVEMGGGCDVAWSVKEAGVRRFPSK